MTLTQWQLKVTGHDAKDGNIFVYGFSTQQHSHLTVLSLPSMVVRQLLVLTAENGQQGSQKSFQKNDSLFRFQFVEKPGGEVLD